MNAELASPKISLDEIGHLQKWHDDMDEDFFRFAYLLVLSGLSTLKEGAWKQHFQEEQDPSPGVLLARRRWDLPK